MAKAAIVSLGLRMRISIEKNFTQIANLKREKLRERVREIKFEEKRKATNLRQHPVQISRMRKK